MKIDGRREMLDGRPEDREGNQVKLRYGLFTLCYQTAGLGACYFFSAGLKSSATPFMQYRRPVGLGPSSNTCPR